MLTQRSNVMLSEVEASILTRFEILHVRSG